MLAYVFLNNLLLTAFKVNFHCKAINLTNVALRYLIRYVTVTLRYRELLY